MWIINLRTVQQHQRSDTNLFRFSQWSSVARCGGRQV
jgi:hypothetical protein